jgi:hypothetical protein
MALYAEGERSSWFESGEGDGGKWAAMLQKGQFSLLVMLFLGGNMLDRLAESWSIVVEMRACTLS